MSQVKEYGQRFDLRALIIADHTPGLSAVVGFCGPDCRLDWAVVEGHLVFESAVPLGAGSGLRFHLGEEIDAEGEEAFFNALRELIEGEELAEDIAAAGPAGEIASLEKARDALVELNEERIHEIAELERLNLDLTRARDGLFRMLTDRTGERNAAREERDTALAELTAANERLDKATYWRDAYLAQLEEVETATAIAAIVAEATTAELLEKLIAQNESWCSRDGHNHGSEPTCKADGMARIAATLDSDIFQLLVKYHAVGLAKERGMELPKGFF